MLTTYLFEEQVISEDSKYSERFQIDKLTSISIFHIGKAVLSVGKQLEITSILFWIEQL